MDNMVDLRILESMTDLEILDLIRHDIKKCLQRLDKAEESWDKFDKKIDNRVDELAQSYLHEEPAAELLEHEEELVAITDGIVEEKLCDDGAGFGDSFSDDPELEFMTIHQQIDVDDATSTYVVEEIDDLPLIFTDSFRFEEYDPFWIVTLNSTTEALEHLRMKNLVSTCRYALFLYSLIGRYLHFILKDGHVFVERTMVRDYDGFNGPGSSQCPFNFRLALVRDYDGFNGPGHTLRTRCL